MNLQHICDSFHINIAQVIVHQDIPKATNLSPGNLCGTDGVALNQVSDSNEIPLKFALFSTLKRLFLVLKLGL